MCRKHPRLFNFDPPATSNEIRAAALQYVRKVSGTQRRVARTFARFERGPCATSHPSRAGHRVIGDRGASQKRQAEAASARARSARRFGRSRENARSAQATYQTDGPRSARPAQDRPTTHLPGCTGQAGDAAAGTPVQAPASSGIGRRVGRSVVGDDCGLSPAKDGGLTGDPVAPNRSSCPPLRPG